MLKFGTITAASLFFVLALFLANRLFSTPLLWCAIPLLIWCIITLIGSFFIRLDYYFKSFHANKDCTENQVAITFDDGPHPKFTPKVLALLNQYGAKATFFCIGKNAEEFPEILKEIIADGHTIGNHTYTHSNTFGFFSTKKVIVELRKTITVVKAISGKEINLYRPAFGVTNPNIKRAIKAIGLQSIGWNIRSLDTTKLSQETVLNRITTSISRGDIILLHDTSSKTIVVLEQLLLFLQENNLRSVTVDQLLNIEAYA